MEIRYGFHGADLIGPHEDEAHYDIPASAALYAKLVEARLQAEYPPSATIKIAYDLDASGVMTCSLRTEVDGDEANAECEFVEHLANLVYQDANWRVFADKEFRVTYGPPSNPLQTTVTFSTVKAKKRLTPRMAAAAARIACGHCAGVTVWSNDDHGYRLYANRHRKLYRD